MAGVFTEKGRFGHRHAHRENAMCTWRQRSWWCLSQGTLMIASKPPRARREAWNRFSTALKRNRTCRHLDLGPLASRPVTQYCFAIHCHPVSDTLLWQPQQTNTDAEKWFFFLSCSLATQVSPKWMRLFVKCLERHKTAMSSPMICTFPWLQS